MMTFYSYLGYRVDKKKGKHVVDTKKTCIYVDQEWAGQPNVGVVSLSPSKI